MPLDFRYCVDSFHDLPENPQYGTVAYIVGTGEIYIFTEGWENLYGASDMEEKITETNCPNCAAVIDRSFDACPYCGTPYR